MIWRGRVNHGHRQCHCSMERMGLHVHLPQKPWVYFVPFFIERCKFFIPDEYLAPPYPSGMTQFEFYLTSLSSEKNRFHWAVMRCCPYAMVCFAIIIKIGIMVDGQTDGHITHSTAYTALAWRRAVKVTASFYTPSFRIRWKFHSVTSQNERMGKEIELKTKVNSILLRRDAMQQTRR